MGDYGPDPQAQQCSDHLEMRNGFCSSTGYQDNTHMKASRQRISITGDGLEPHRTARVMVLHGHAQSGPSFQAKTQFFRFILERALPDIAGLGCDHPFPEGFELFYPTAPHRIRLPDPTSDTGENATSETSKTVENPPQILTTEFEGWAWGFGDYSRGEIQGLEDSTRYLLGILQTEGPFVGIVGFSTGATMAMILVTLVERGAPPEIMKAFQLDVSVSGIICNAAALKAQDSHFGVQMLPPSFKFAIIASGVTLSHPRYKPFYYPKIQTPVLHFMGEFDTHIPSADMLKLSRVCKNCTTVRHPGAHFMPRYRHCQVSMSNFIVEHLRA